MPTQPDLFDPGLTAAEVADLRSLLAERGWQTRKQISQALGWPERKIRLAAESLGNEVVRSQAGFKLTATITRDEMPLAIRAAEAAISQGKKMVLYGIHLKTRLHQLIG